MDASFCMLFFVAMYIMIVTVAIAPSAKFVKICKIHIRIYELTSYM